jgi:hypothetical protein
MKTKMYSPDTTYEVSDAFSIPDTLINIKKLHDEYAKLKRRATNRRCCQLE